MEELENETRVTLPDEDAGPTKAWLVGVRDTPEWHEHFEWVYGKRPKYELYDLKKDPDETKNVAEEPEYVKVRADLEAQLMEELQSTGDPRLIEDGKFFETPPMAGPLPPVQKPSPKGKGKEAPKKSNPKAKTK